MSLTSGIGRMVASAALPLTVPAVLSRGASNWDIQASVQRQKKPARAGHTGGDYDALIRVHAPDIPEQPAQNDLILVDGDTWIVWTFDPSAAGASIMVKAMAPPAEAVTPLHETETDDGGGGKTMTWEPQDSVLAKIRGVSADRALTSESSDTLNRLIMSWPYNPAEPMIDVGVRVDVRGLEYTVRSMGIRDDNPTWRRAVLARET